MVMSSGEPKASADAGFQEYQNGQSVEIYGMLDTHSFYGQRIYDIACALTDMDATLVGVGMLKKGRRLKISYAQLSSLEVHLLPKELANNLNVVLHPGYA